MSAATQSSVAVSSSQDLRQDGGQGPGDAVTLLNASPDIRAQIERTPLLQPSADGPLRSSPITSVVLTNGDVDHITGLLSLREGSPFTLFATPQVLAALAANPVFNVLRPGIVDRVPIAADTPIRAPDKGVL
ncbi:MAG: MBL fold metallo-hydrolase, partial [Pseudomonadota bacterium]